VRGALDPLDVAALRSNHLTFSLILAVFLAGIGLGSSAGATLARGLARPRVALGWCQLALCAAMAWTSWVLTDSLPYWPINPSIAPNAWYQFSWISCVRSRGFPHPSSGA
jgi:hypothetical protein